MMFMFPFALVIIAGIVIFVIWALRRTVPTQGFQQRSQSNALVILKERYAKGEISKNDFESIKNDIG